MPIKQSLAEIVGKEHVLDDPKKLESYIEDSSSALKRAPNYVVQPKSTAEVQRIVQLANEEKMPIIPSSSGIHRNGGAVPTQGGIVVDLRRMNRILEIDERNRKVMIEPGVTWEQLGPELGKHQLLMMNPLLPHANSSVLTSCLEREPWLNPKYEYGEPISSMEMVWPTGEIFRTGTASAPGFPDTFSEGAYPYGPGTLDPLRLLQGAQGTMGIVTWANVKVEYLPQVNKSFLIPFERVEDMVEAIYAIERRRIGNECLGLNNFNLAGILASDGPKEIDGLCKALPPWSLLLVLSGPRWFPEEKIAYEEEALNEVQNNRFPFTELLDVVPGFGSADKLPALLRNPRPEYWKSSYKGASRNLFFITLAEDAPKFVEVMQGIAGAHGYDPAKIGIYVQPIEYASACHLEFDLFYDGDDPAEVERVQGLFNVATRELLNLGAHFTRPYGKELSDLVYEKAGSYTTLLKRTKKLFDPHNIMNPGKLCF